MRRALGQPPAASPLAVSPAPSRTSAERLLASQTASDPLGPAARELAQQVLVQVCSQAGANRLTSLCALGSQHTAPSLQQIRLALLRDVLANAERAVQSSAGATSPEVQSARLMLAAFRAANQSPDPRTWPETLFAEARQSFRCPAGQDRCLPLRLAPAILTRILRDGPTLDRPDPYYRNVVEEVVRDELRQPAFTLPP